VQDPEIVVVAAGEGPDVRSLLPEAPLVIAADGGVERAHALGLDVALVVGDLDSADPTAVAAAERRGAVVVRHPTDKDATDLELALREAAARAPRRLLVVASSGGRLDHLVSGLHVLGAHELAEIEVDALVGDALVHVVRGERTLRGSPGETVTLLALHGPAGGVTTDGLTYPLAAETLRPESSRGVSNVFASATARVVVDSGVVLVIRGLPTRDDVS
jgi:thiamine pyrophosphokinase